MVPVRCACSVAEDLREQGMPAVEVLTGGDGVEGKEEARSPPTLVAGLSPGSQAACKAKAIRLRVSSMFERPLLPCPSQ